MAETAETYEFAAEMTVEGVDPETGERYSETFKKGSSVTPKSEQQEHAARQALEAMPDLVKLKKGRSS